MPVKSTGAAVAYPSRTQQRMETRGRIFDAAVAEFRRVGVAATQIEDIVKAAGVARGTFYLHFATKDHVLMELVRHDQRAVADRMRPAMGDDVGSFLRATVDTILDVVADEEPSVTREVFTAVLRHAGNIEGEDLALVQLLVAFFETAQARGDVRTDISRAELASLFLTAVFGMFLLRDEPAGDDLRTRLHQAVDVLVRGIAP